MDIKEEVKKVEAEMKVLQERFLILTGAKQALTNVLNALAGETNGTEQKDGQKEEKPDAPNG